MDYEDFELLFDRSPMFATKDPFLVMYRIFVYFCTRQTRRSLTSQIETIFVPSGACEHRQSVTATLQCPLAAFESWLGALGASKKTDAAAGIFWLCIE